MHLILKTLNTFKCISLHICHLPRVKNDLENQSFYPRF